MRQRFGVSLICSIPGITHFLTEQAERYYAQAEASLVKAGEPASECLDNLRGMMSEIRQEAESEKSEL